MITDYTTFIQYFRELAQQHTQLAGSFFVGDSWRIISAQRSEITYPAMWLEYPIKTHDLENDEDTLLTEIDFAFSIVGGQPVDDWAAQDARLNECERIMGQFIARLKKDSDDNLFDLILPMRAEPLATVMADDLYGWRVEGKLKVRSWTDCYDADDWTGIAATPTILNGGTVTIEDGHTLVIPAGSLLEKLLIASATTQAVSVGTAPAGNQIIDGQNIVANDYLVHTEDVYAHGAPKTLYFTCTDPITVKYYIINFSD
jgi:hypothetical protein